MAFSYNDKSSLSLNDLATEPTVIRASSNDETPELTPEQSSDNPYQPITSSTKKTQIMNKNRSSPRSPAPKILKIPEQDEQEQQNPSSTSTEIRNFTQKSPKSPNENQPFSAPSKKPPPPHIMTNGGSTPTTSAAATTSTKDFSRTFTEGVDEPPSYVVIS